MGVDTKIPWCDSTINPVVGCNGCELHRAGQADSHCFAAGLVRRYAGLPGWPASFDQPEFFAGRIEKACNWPDLTGKKRPEKPCLDGYPRLIFVCDLADPFTESIDPESWLTPALPRMAASPHIFLLLTKRGRRMLDYFDRHPVPRNFWLGVTVTGPDTTARLDYLRKIPGASVKFVSMEPLLNAVDIGRYLTRLDWVVVGGESGPNPRPMHPRWARDVRGQCVAVGVPFFYKQDGSWAHCERGPLSSDSHYHQFSDGQWMCRQDGKGSNLLDGERWEQLPGIQVSRNEHANGKIKE